MFPYDTTELRRHLVPKACTPSRLSCSGTVLPSREVTFIPELPGKGQASHPSLAQRGDLFPN